MKIKTSELSGAALDWAVAKCEGRNITLMRNTNGTLFKQPVWADGIEQCNYSNFWAQGGPIIEREFIALDFGHPWRAFTQVEEAVGDDIVPVNVDAYGPTPLIAAMRCYVSSKLGDEVEVPEELT